MLIAGNNRDPEINYINKDEASKYVVKKENDKLKMKFRYHQTKLRNQNVVRDD